VTTLWRGITDDWRITYLSIVIVIIVTLAGGLMVYLIMQRQSEMILDKELAASARDHATEIAALINSNINYAHALASRTFVINKLKSIDASTSDAQAAGRELMLAIKPIVPNVAFSDIALYSTDNHLVAQWGEINLHPQLSIPLAGALNIHLIYANGTYLRTGIGVNDGKRHLGRIVILSPMPKVDAMIKNAAQRGKTAEFALCGPLGDDMTCFRTTLTHHVFPRLPRHRNGKPLPMSYALDGRTGVVTSHDYRGKKVEAAYTAVRPFGLGVVLKIDTEELYASVRKQIFYVAPYILGLMLTGVLLIRWRVLPLVRKLVESERYARESNEKLAENEAHTRAVVENIDDGLVIFEESGTIESANSAAKRIFGYEQNKIIGLQVFQLLSRDDEQRDYIMHLFLNPGDHMGDENMIELNGLRKDGSSVPISLRVTEMRWKGRRTLIGVFNDITRRKAYESEIIYLANHDALTGLPNRNLLNDRIGQAISYARRKNNRTAVLFIDLDHFKNINDSLGHQTGDHLLQQVSKLIRSQVREGDTVARQGGDEFIVVLPDISQTEHAAHIAQKILHALGAPIWTDGREFHSSASIGISIFPDDGLTVESLLQNSDAAMYHAKHLGRGTYQFYTPEMNTMVAERLELESGLRHALSGGELLLHYQPIVDFQSNTIISVEALLRWKTHSGEWIPADKFIPVAEDTGMIVPIGEWVLKTACGQLNKWRTAGFDHFRISVNVSLRQLTRKDFIDMIRQTLKENGVSPESLELEITESVIMENPVHTLVILNELHDIGVNLAIDDFGTGYSSLSHLKQFPINKLKIDMSFIRDVVFDPNDAAIVAAIIAMAKSLNIRVVAEGVETQEQLRFLSAQPCDEYQGYLYSRPLPAEDLSHLLAGIPQGR